MPRVQLAAGRSRVGHPKEDRKEVRPMEWMSKRGADDGAQNMPDICKRELDGQSGKERKRRRKVEQTSNITQGQVEWMRRNLPKKMPKSQISIQKCRTDEGI